MVDDATRELILRLSEQIDRDRMENRPSHLQRKGERALDLIDKVGVQYVRDEFPEKWQDLLEFSCVAATMRLMLAGLKEDGLKLLDAFMCDQAAKIHALRPDLPRDVIKEVLMRDGK